ncbi:MAG: TetR/AcrR family transcriptional regulator [Actinomycetota bacterium]|nr:TetR/AcrR family transcriptional regulator [Actinomycetota bacterium]
MATGGRRREILAAAREVFLEKGFEASTTREIGAKAGVLKGSLYHYINSKDDLLFEVLAEIHRKGMGLLERMEADTDGSPADRLARFVDSFVRHQVDNRLDAELFDREMRSLEPARRMEIADRFEAHFRTLIEEGQREGVFDNALDPVAASKGVFLMLNHLYVWYRPEGRLAVDDLAANYVRLVGNALGAARG